MQKGAASEAAVKYRLRSSTWFDRACCFPCVCVCMKRVEENRNEYVRHMSEVVEDEEEDEEEDVAALSSLDSYQLCQKYQQAMNSPQHAAVKMH